MLKFKTYLEAKDLYGFAKQVPAPKPQEDDMPIQPFDLLRLFDRVSKTKIGSMEAYRPFDDFVRWGRSEGAIRARLTPNQGICVERMTSDLNGDPLWITKKLFKIKTEEFVGKEDVVAGELTDYVKEIANEQLDSPVAEYKGLYELTKKVAEIVKGNVHEMFVYQELKKVNDNNYNILFSLVGAGVGKLVHRSGGGYTPAGIIDMSYNPERGTIKSILSTVSIENDADPWSIDIPYFMGEFSPTQPVQEIVRTIVAGLKFI